MTVKKMSKILTFILVLAMVLGTVAMAEVPTPAANTPATQEETVTYTITAGTFTNGQMTIKYGTTQSPLASGASLTVEKDTEITVEFSATAGYEFVKATYKIGEKETSLSDGGKFTLTGDATITPVFQAKSTLGGEKTADSFRLDAICSGSYYWQMYHKDMANNKKYTKYPGSPADKVNPSSEIVKGNYVDLTLYVTDNDFLKLCSSTGYSKNNFSVTTPGDSSFLAGSGAGAEIEK